MLHCITYRSIGPKTPFNVVGPTPSSMPPRKETPEEKSRRLLRAGANLAVKADMQLCIGAMRENSESIRHVMKTLVDLGFIDTSGNIVNATSGSEQQAALTDIAAGAPGASPGQPGKGKASDPEFDMDEPVPETWAVLANASVEFLQWCLKIVEPVAFSGHAVKAMLKGGQRKVPKTTILEIFEFLFDLDEDTPLHGVGTFGSFVESIRTRSQANDRRGRDIVLPARWPAMGAYSLKVLDGKPFLGSRFTSQAVEVTDIGMLGDRPLAVKDFTISNICSLKWEVAVLPSPGLPHHAVLPSPGLPQQGLPSPGVGSCSASHVHRCCPCP